MSKQKLEGLLNRMNYLIEAASNVKNGNAQFYSICSWDMYDKEDKDPSAKKYTIYGRKSMKSRLQVCL